jgi:tetratricopeptide (TPR) repeat protein
MSRRAVFAVACSLCCWPATSSAGLYYSGETIANLPSQWRGFLLDQRALRLAAVKPAPGKAGSPLRIKYLEALANLEKLAQKRALTSDESADLGALYIRLGESDKAVACLRAAQRIHPKHFHLAANLGTAWQMQGDLQQAAASLREAVKLAPGKNQPAEELQLRLVELRQKTKSMDALDDLFGIRFLNAAGVYEAGKIAPTDQKKLPADALAQVQQLALWLPADVRLLWLLGEMANVQGDAKTAAAIFDGCVTEFNSRAPDLRQHRQITRAAVDMAAKANEAGQTHGGGESASHLASWRPRSKRPLANLAERTDLPPVNATGTNYLPWTVLGDTVVDRDFRPNFPRYLLELEGKSVTLTGFIQPLNEDLELGSFMLIEYPIGCWYCEMPELNSIVFVELSAGKTFTHTKTLVKVTGTLHLNKTDPENFLYTLEGAKATAAD